MIEKTFEQQLGEDIQDIIHCVTAPPARDDSEAEYEALRKLIQETGLNMIQWRNFNIDPDWYMGKIGFHDSGEMIGVKQMMELLREEFPDLKFGYFNPPIERIKGDFNSSYAGAAQ